MGAGGEVNMKLQQLDKALFLFFNNSNFQFLKIKHTAISINTVDLNLNPPSSINSSGIAL